ASIDQARAKRTANFYQSLDLPREYAQLLVGNIEKVGDHDAYVVTGFPAGDTPDRLYFDTKTGLLLRKISVLPSPLGDSPFQVDYDEYRDTGSGVKIRFVIRMTPGNPRSEPQTHSTFRILKVRDNVAIDDAKFQKPPSVPPP